MAETLTIRTASSTEVVKIASVGPQGPKGDKGDPGDVAGLPLSTQGDLLYRGSSENQRLAIGTSGQVLKVANGIPAWANESGSVTSVNGETGAVTLDGSDIDTSGNDDLAAFVAYEFADGNGLYYPLPDSTLNSKRVYRTTTGHHVFFQSLRWHITDGSPITANIIESSDDDNAAWPWLSAWDGSMEKAQLSTVVGRARSTFLFVGDSVPNTSVSGLGTAATADSTAFAAASHTHTGSQVTVGTTANLPLRTGTGGVIEAGSFSNTAGSFCAGDDARLSDARTPLAHAASHAAAGSDPVTLELTQVVAPSGGIGPLGNGESLYDYFFSAGNIVFSNTEDFVASGSITTSGLTQATARILGRTTASTGAVEELAASDVRTFLNTDELSATRTPTSHVHGNLTNDGKVGTTANLPLKTGTNGVIEAGSFGTSAGTFCQGNDARLSDARTPSSTLAHAASHAAGVRAEFKDIPAGATTPVLVRANAAGTAGNSITLTFNGSQSIINRLSAWNSANPSNQATLIWGDGSQIPENGAGFTLSGGVAGGSDPIPSFSQLAVNDGNGVSLVSLNGASSDIIEFESEELTFQHTGGSGTPYISVTDESNNEALLGLRQGEMFLQGSNPNVRIEQNGGVLANILMASAKLVDDLGFDEQGPYTATIDVQEQLTDDVTLTIPDQSGTLAVVTDIPTTAGDVGAVAAGAITTSGLTQATARILGRTSSSTGAVEELAASDVRSFLNVADGAEQNVNADWNALSGDAQILNKPTLAASATTDTTNASNISTGTLAVARMGSGTPSASNYLRGDGSWQTVAAGVGGGTGSTDNAIIRADGAGSSTVQSSDINIEDATTSTANNVTISNQHSGQTNSSLVWTGKGTGALIWGPKPDGTSTGGNARGSRAVDLQPTRDSAARVASGTNAFAIGHSNLASGTRSFAGGTNCTASSESTFAFGDGSSCSGAYGGIACGDGNSTTGFSAATFGFSNTASGNYSIAAGARNISSGTNGSIALGAGATAAANGQISFSSGRPSTQAAGGICQLTVFTLYGNTTTNSAVELFGGMDNAGSVRFSVPSGHIMTGLIFITGARTNGTGGFASYCRQFSIKNVGGTTSLIGTVNTVGTDEAASTSIAITANDTNDALKVECTGVASESWKWIAAIQCAQRTYAI